MLLCRTTIHELDFISLISKYVKMFGDKESVFYTFEEIVSLFNINRFTSKQVNE